MRAALEHGASFSFALRTRRAGGSDLGEVVRMLDVAGVELLTVGSDAFREFGETETPQGILGVAREPESALPLGSDSGGQASETGATAEQDGREPSTEVRVVILDGIQDPGNAGTLVRTSVAMGAHGILVLSGTVDPWNAKAVRASAGLIFRLPPFRLSWDEARSWAARMKLALLVAHQEGRDVRDWQRAGGTPAHRRSGWALVLGNEGSGPRPEVVRDAETLLAVPLPSGVESLNVATAGAILLWSLGPGSEAASPRRRDP